MTKYKNLHSEFNIPGSYKQYAPDIKLEPIHMELDLKFDILNKSVQGTNVITLKSNVTDAQSLTLNAVDFEEVSVLEEDLEYSYNHEEIVVNLKSPFLKVKQKR